MEYNDLSIVILAAGQGRRMCSPLPKPLQLMAGKPLLRHILAAVTPLRPLQTIVVYSRDKGLFQQHIPDTHITWVEQSTIQGTGHAALCALPIIRGKRTLILLGDTPLITSAHLASFLAEIQMGLGLITAHLTNPSGFGRIIRGADNQVVDIVEEKDASISQKAITEVSSGIIMAPTDFLHTALKQLNKDNSQQEYYLPQIIPQWQQQGKAVQAICIPDGDSIKGINTFNELAILESLYQHRIANQLMQNVVRITQPAGFNCHATVLAEAGAQIANNVTLHGNVTLGAGCDLGPSAS